MVRIIIALLLGTVAAGSASAQSIGFVNVERVIVDYKLTSKLTEELQKEGSRRQEEFRQKLQALRAREAQMRTLDRNSLDYARQLKDLELERTKLVTMRDMVMVENQIRMEEHLKLVYKEVVQVVEGIARSKGMIAVFQITDSELVGKTKDAVTGAMMLRNTIWCHESVDITKEVLTRLNEDR